MNQRPELPQAFLLAEMAVHPDRLAWQPLRPGIEVHWLYRSPEGGPAAAMLRYAPGASTGLHHHTGLEHILVLAGEQQDERGRYPRGSLLVSPPGSSHTIHSPGGCIVLAIWEKPVVFDL